MTFYKSLNLIMLKLRISDYLALTTVTHSLQIFTQSCRFCSVNLHTVQGRQLCFKIDSHRTARLSTGNTSFILTCLQRCFMLSVVKVHLYNHLGFVHVHAVDVVGPHQQAEAHQTDRNW